jgi:subtilisin family serine protease
MRRVTLTLLLAAALVGWSAAAASANPWGPPPSPGSARYVPGQLIVKFRADADASQRADALHRRDARTLRSLPLPRTRVVSLPADADVESAAAALERDPAVAWAEPNAYQVAGSMPLPNDELFGQQWGLHNTGQTVKGVTGVAGADIHAPEAWERTTGSSAVRVAVVDSGVNLDHPDLAPNIWKNPGESGGGRESNGIDDDGNGFVDDWRGWDFIQHDNNPSDPTGHGTHVAGIIGARGNNGIGTAGVSWNVSLMPVRVLNNLEIGSCADIAAGFAYAARAGAQVVNVSIWGYNRCQAEEDAIAAAPGTLFVTIAGNDGIDDDATPTYPCSFPEPNIVCVAATGLSDELSDFSSYGARSVDLAAPGDWIDSTYVKWQPQETLYTDSFETPLTGRWVTGGTNNTWGRTTEAARSGSYSLADSPFASYASGTDSYAELREGLDLTNENDCVLGAGVRLQLGAGDALLGAPSIDGRDGAEIAASGVTRDFEPTFFDLAPLEGRSTGSFYFDLLSRGSAPADGVYIDDVTVLCMPTVTTYTGGIDEYVFDFGTSMAAPHVAGVAALVLSLAPTMSTAQLKAQILNSVDPVPGLAGKVATGGRLDAARAVDLPRPAAPARAPAASSRSPRARTCARASALAANLCALRTALRRLDRRALLRRGTFAVTLRAPRAGRLAVTLRRGTATIATGSRRAPRAGRVRVNVRLTRRGRRILRRAHRLDATMTVRFQPRSGKPVSRSAAVRLR